MGIFQKLINWIFSSYQKTLGLFAVSLIAISIPLTVNLIQSKYLMESKAEEVSPRPTPHKPKDMMLDLRVLLDIERVENMKKEDEALQDISIDKSASSLSANNQLESTPKQLAINLRIFDSSNRLKKEIMGNLVYEKEIFKGKINLGSDLPNGEYYIDIDTTTTLARKLPDPYYLIKGEVTSIGYVIYLTSGDINNDNEISVEDWNLYHSCYEDRICDLKALADLDLDGEVATSDGKILIRSYERQAIKP